MKWLAYLAVLLMASTATAELTAWATYNTDSGDWAVDAGFDYVKRNDGPQPATMAWYNSVYGQYDAAGKFDGCSTVSNAGDGHGGNYVTFHASGQERSLLDAQGTVEFWFRPDWDPATDTDAHCLVFLNLSTTTGDGLRVAFNGDGTVATRMITQSVNQGGSEADVGHTWDSMALIDDWNHVAFVWDADGNRTYCNGSKVGETTYSGPGPDKVDWAEDMYFFTGQNANLPIFGGPWMPSLGSWDSVGFYDTAEYAGDTYDMPTWEVGSAPALPGDRNGDGFVGQFDLDIVLAMWGNSGAEITDPRADANEDDFVGQTDLDYVLSDWGQGVPLTAPVPEPATLGIFALCGFALLRRRPKSR